MVELKEERYSTNQRILLHACCAICSGYPISFLKESGYDVIVYFYNPNIYPESEYYRRLEAEIKLCEYFNTDLIIGDYNTADYYDFVKGLENEPEKGLRCVKCFEYRLNKSALKALELEINNFTTSMVISPHKNYDKLTSIGKSVAQKYNLNYLSYNFRKNDGFLKTNKISYELNLYRQDYCGCQFALNKI